MNKRIKNIIKESLLDTDKNLGLIKENEDLTKIRGLKNSIEKKLKKVYLDITNKELELPKIDIKIDDDIVDGKIAGFNHPKNGKNGLMGIKSKALNDMEYLKWVITHELIHAVLVKIYPNIRNTMVCLIGLLMVWDYLNNIGIKKKGLRNQTFFLCFLFITS